LRFDELMITDPKENTTQYQYDDFRRRFKVISPDTGTTAYVHDEAGNISQKTDARGTVVHYTYDALNRITAIQFPADSTQNITYSYDSTSVTYGKERLTGRTDSSGSYTFYYDARGNVTKEEKTINSVLYTTQYSYNKDNVLTSITHPSGRTISYTLDVTGRVIQVDTTLSGNPKTLASSITYLPYGGITGLTFGNTLSLTHGHDNQYRTSSIVVGSILDRIYNYDANGNVTFIDDSESAGNETLETAGIYSYDQGTNLLADMWREVPVVYDYDENGNTISANNRTFSYDLSNRLITVQEGSTTLGQYVYNGLNQRIKKTVQGQTAIFHYDLQGRLIAETNESGTTLAEYFYLGDQPLAMIRPGEALYYYHNDHLGTSQILTDDTGAVSWKAVYTPFGEAEIVVATVENPLRFLGQYYDQETGLHYNWHRYYDPRTGRYLTPDAIGLKGGSNLFIYVNANPLIYIDPLGMVRCVASITPPHPDDCTIVCDGAGGIKVELGWCASKGRCMKRICETHEKSHISDCDNASTVCAGKPAGVEVTLTNMEDRKKSECEAYKLDLSLTNASLNSSGCCEEKDDLEKNEEYVERQIKRFCGDGTYEKKWHPDNRMYRYYPVRSQFRSR